MARRCLQANINHSARAQDLLVQSMAEWQIDVAVVSEPYVVHLWDDWVSDHEGVVAIVAPAVAGSPAIEGVARGRGFVVAAVGGMAVVGVYASPNRSLAEFEQLLVESLEEWAVSLGLAVINSGSESTCVRQQGESIVDVKFASIALARRVRDWRVETAVETLSDHRYIRYDVSAAPVVRPAVVRSEGPRWSLGRLDSQLAKEAAIVEAWCAGSDPVVQVDREADRLGAALFRICDVAMPRVKPQTPRRRVYWWRPELRQLRRACVAARRQYARCRRRRVRDHDLEAALYTAYRDACVTLQKAIAQAKEAAWTEWLGTLDRDPWGRPYRVVRQKLRPWTPPLTTLQPHLLESVASALFPERREFVPPSMAPLRSERDERDLALPVTEAELSAAVLRLRSKRTAPGPDGIPGRALVIVSEEIGENIRRLFSACLAQGRFPDRWKTGRLVLIRKEGRAPDQPSAYRPIVLLDEVSKLFERVLAVRLVDSMEPDQYGFRRGRSTLDAIARVRDLAEEEVAQGGVLLAVSLDISNAFNSLPWEVIREALRYHNVPCYLQRLIGDYFAGRAVSYPTSDGWRRRRAVFHRARYWGPFCGTSGTTGCCAGPLCGGSASHATPTTPSCRPAAAPIARRLIEPQPASHTRFTASVHWASRWPCTSHITVGRTSITIGSTMKYLGFTKSTSGAWPQDWWLQPERWGGFSPMSEDREARAGASSDGAQGGSGVPYGVIHCSLPAVRKPAMGPRGRDQLERLLAAEGSESGGRPTPSPGSSELEGIGRRKALRKMEREATGSGIGNVYHLTQLLTGHGCFAKYLCDLAGREPTTTCHHCGNGAVDTAEHTRAECPAWAEPRAALFTAIGYDISLPALVRKMVASAEAWAALRVFSETVMSAKEAAERQREDDTNSLPLRRRRPGRRRRDHLGRMP
ncbi:uncharacterized protein LOC125075390 [Vanessa atalanta]|uniref:uncharacterized protein LOC125075390 n=1 Tax=Vanessa atalanta TaxID=42275 RepID=UPI001FCDF27D|nr:uncharacterized protein LOC125075390 [Vanessa atalanta]